MRNLFIGVLTTLPLLGSVGCKKLVAIPAPINSITTGEVFSSDTLAASAISGIYTQMINGTGGITNSDLNTSFSNGVTTVTAGLSSDELAVITQSNGAYIHFYTNRLLADDPTTPTLWTSAYNAVYGANAVIGGIAASTSPGLHDYTRKELTAESKLVRAFCYFYLVNLFGDVPLALTIDFNQTAGMARTPTDQVYQQIIQDLKDAYTDLPGDYSVGGGQRIRPNRWAAAALLARVYLYNKQYNDAAALADSVIGQTGLFGLEADLNNVFSTGSREAIWQLQQSNQVTNVGNATPEGMAFIPYPIHTGTATWWLSDNLMNAFEPGDQRKNAWIGRTIDSISPTLDSTGVFFYPFKYKTGSYNYVSGGTPTEYYMVLRLAEVYLIRAEAEANGAPGGTAAAIADLDVLRARAGLAPLDPGLTPAQVTAAVAHERQVELFAEWGHRWFDLKRTGQAQTVLSAISVKQPWQGNGQLLYPIPLQEIQNDHSLQQNPGY